MKTCLILEDTPQGISAKLLWQHSGCQDNLHESVSMHTMANFVKEMEKLEKLGCIRLFRSTDGPGALPSVAV